LISPIKKLQEEVLTSMNIKMDFCQDILKGKPFGSF